MGTIAEIKNEHGFYMCRIDLGDVYTKGSRFTNVFKADLYDSFARKEEHWTQEIALPTRHLTIRIHFPDDRKPKSLRCNVVEGLKSRQVKTAAKLGDVAGENYAIWEIEQPKMKDVFKLEWSW